MKNLVKYIMAIIRGVALFSCGAATKELARMSQSKRTDVFTEKPREGPALKGFVDLVVKASTKYPFFFHNINIRNNDH